MINLHSTGLKIHCVLNEHIILKETLIDLIQTLNVEKLHLYVLYRMKKIAVQKDARTDRP